MKNTYIIIGVICLIILGSIAAFVGSIRPWQSKILDHGYSPAGVEYCVIQTYKTLIEPYQVSIYIRDSDGIWRWNYLEHEDNGWKSASVTFSNDTATVSRNGKVFRDVKIPTDTIDIASIQPGYRDRYLTSDYTVDDVFEYHNQNHSKH
jgi:hypothetical protein